MAGEIEVSYKRNSEFEKFKINNSISVEEYLRKMWPIDMSLKESFVVLYANNSLEIIGSTIVSVGAMTSTIVDVKEVIRLALMLGNCNAIFMAHNHPSGKLLPSEQDRNLTKKVKDACGFFDMKLIDHIILAPESGRFSFTDEGEL